MPRSEVEEEEESEFSDFRDNEDDLREDDSSPVTEPSVPTEEPK
jgi:hypothetical protein